MKTLLLAKPSIDPQYFGNDSLNKRGSTNGGARPQDGNNLRYYFDSSFPQEKRDLVRQAAQGWTDRTTMNLVEDSNNAIKIIRGGGCYYNGAEISVGESCDSFNTIAHEFGHALGLVHEQKRADRDDYINIHWDNIDENKWSQFENSSTYIPYDYDSVMH
jgi:hypothetical protein